MTKILNFTRFTSIGIITILGFISTSSLVNSGSVNCSQPTSNFDVKVCNYLKTQEKKHRLNPEKAITDIANTEYSNVLLNKSKIGRESYIMYGSIGMDNYQF